MDLSGRAYIVGGVGVGLGSAVVATLAAAGADVLGVARRRASTDVLERLAVEKGWSFHPVEADLSRTDDCDRVVRTALEAFGRLDGASLNMGRWIPGDPLVHKTTDAEWSSGLTENLDAIFRLSRAMLPTMIERHRGSIVLVSAAERVRLHGNASYCVAKAGLIDLMRKMAADYRPMGVRVNAVLPGTMEHELDPARPPVERDDLPLNNDSGSGAWEVARAIRFLLSDESRWVSGTQVTVDGGYSTHGKETTPKTPA